MKRHGLKTKKEKERERLALLEEERVRRFLEKKYEEDAKHKWAEELLLPVEEFTLEAYEEIMKDPEELADAGERRKERDDRVKKLFESFLPEKEKTLARAWSWYRVKRRMGEAMESTKTTLKAVAKEVEVLLEPYDVKVDRRVSESLNRINVADHELESWLRHRDRVLERMDEMAKAEKVATRRRKIELEVQEATTGFIKADQERVATEMRQQRVEQFQAQRKAESDARLKARRDVEEAEKRMLDEEIDRVRKWRMKHWLNKATSFREEARLRQEEKARQEQAKVDEAIKKDLDEDKDRDMGREEEQTMAPATSDDTILPSGARLGVYGLPYREGDEPGVDDYDVGLFEPHMQIEAEEKRLPIYESQAEEARYQMLYDQLQSECRMFSSEIDNLKDTKARLETDLGQLQQENQLLLHELEKPTNRYPSVVERQEMHHRKPRMKVLKERIEEMDHELVRLEQKKREVEGQSLCLAKDLAVMKEKNKALLLELEKEENVEGGVRMPDLPVVVGQHISKLAGVGTFRGRPKESYNIVVQQSRLELYKDQSKAVLSSLKEAHEYDRKVWLGAEEKRAGSFMLEEMLSRLKEAQDKVKHQERECVKQDIVTALRLFYSSREKLSVVDREMSGQAMWWKGRSEKDCLNVEQFWSSEEVREEHENNNKIEGQEPAAVDHEERGQKDQLPEKQAVTLGLAKTGRCVGILQFPRLDLWTVEFIVTKRYPNVKEQGSEEDFVVIKLGESIRSLNTIGTYYNVVNEDTLSISYEVSYQIKSKSLAYRFEFTSKTEEPSVHMVVLPAVYSTKPIPDLEDLDNNRVLSSFIKDLRVQMAKGTIKNEKMLEELVAASSTTDQDFWDSDVLLDHPQRYDRAEFIKRAEKELRKERDLDKKKNWKPLLTNQELVRPTPQQRRALRSLKSMTTYIKRKRKQHEEVLNEARRLKGVYVTIYDEPTLRWMYYHVEDVRVKWLDQIDPQIRYVLQRYNEWKEKEGEASLWDLSTVRWQEAEEIERDEERYRMFCEGRERQRQLEAQREQTKAARREEMELLRALDDEKEVERFKARQKKLAIAKAQIIADADAKLDDELFRKKLWVNVVAVMEEMKHGLFKDPDGYVYNKPNQLHAEKEAYRRWKDGYIESMCKKTAEELDAAEEQEKQEARRMAAKMERKRLKREARQKKMGDKLARQQETLRNDKLRELAEARRERFQEALHIPNFNKAVVGPPDHPNCEHLKAKAWGHLYGKGLRCIKCGKELTNSHYEPNQLSGIGSGEDPKLVEMVTRHRASSPTFRFNSGEELARVERERIRLEKERRLIQDGETRFYDLEDIAAIYEFDRRHKNFFKQHDIFRQGVQWTEEERGRWKKQQLEYFNALTPRTREKKKLEFEDFMYEREPPPTSRHYDFVRKAAYQDMMFSFARMNNCRTRIMELKSLRVAMMVKRKEDAAQADYIHCKLVDLEELLALYEKTIDEVDGMVKKRERADQDWRSAKELLKTAHVDLRKVEMECVGLDDMMETTHRTVKLRTEEVKTLLRQKIIMSREVQRIMASIESITKKAAELRIGMDEHQMKVEVMNYYKRGEMVPTPYGMAKVLVYRDDDNIVVAQIGTRKVYMPPEKCLQLDRARQQANRVEMEEEEKQLRVFYKTERMGRKKEMALMEEEDIAMTALTKYERQMEYERRVVAEALVEEEKLAWAAMEQPAGKNHIAQKADRVVEEAVEKREQERAKPEGKKKPPVLSAKEKIALKQRTIKQLTEQYVADRVALRKITTEGMLEAQAREKAEVDNLGHVFETILQDFIYDVANQELTIGLETKVRTQVESGIIFMDPPHMQFCIYNTLKSHWIERREFLRNSIELLCAKSTKSMETFGAEAAKFKRLNETMGERTKREAEEKRQLDMNAAMAAEEEYSRKYYREELLLTLRERRCMAQEERAMKMYLLMLKHLEDMKKKQPVVKGEKPPPGLTRNELRRLELKRQQAEKLREEKEGEHMIAEDERSMQFRAYQKMLDAKRKLEDEGVVVFEDKEESDGEESVELNPEEDAVVIPNLPSPITELTHEEVEALIKDGNKSVEEVQAVVQKRKMEIKKRRRRVRAMVESNRRQKALERSAMARWSAMYELAEMESFKSELAWMEAEEESRFMQFDLKTLQDNLRKMSLLSQRKSIEEIRARQDVKAKTAYAEKCRKARDDATFWASKCKEFEHKRRRVRLRVIQDTRYMDTEVIMAFYQRWPTEALYRRLYWDYFTTLSLILVHRVEAIGTERRLMKLQDCLVQNYGEIQIKQAVYKKLSRGLRRKMWMQWRRSEIGRRIFTKSRRRALTKYFEGWVRYTLWQTGYKKAYDLKYTLIKQELDLRRLYPETRGEMVVLPSGSNNEDDEETGAERPGVPPVKKTLLMRHKARPEQCRHCKTFYLEDLNSDMACPFHPGEYKVACPRTCPGLSIKCMSHRLKRWTCCDNRDESTHMKNGCRARRHMSMIRHEPYQSIEEEAKAAYDVQEAALDAELDERRKGDWNRQFFLSGREQMKKIEVGLVAQRDVVARYDKIKHV